MERVYWNVGMETIQPAVLRGLEHEALRTQLDYVWSSSPFYQSKFAQAGIRREAINDIVDLPLLPFTEKDECRSSQQEFPPLGSYLACPPEQLIRVHKTSGTTGRALYVALTHQDRNLMNECAARCFWAAGLRPSDTVVHCLNYRLWVGGYSDHENLETTGATVVPFGVGQTASLIQTIRELGINAISHQYLRLRVELVQGLAAEQVPELPQQIRHLLSQHLNFHAEPELLPYGTLPRSEQKARRVIRTYQLSGR